MRASGMKMNGRRSAGEMPENEPSSPTPLNAASGTTPATVSGVTLFPSRKVRPTADCPGHSACASLPIDHDIALAPLQNGHAEGAEIIGADLRAVSRNSDSAARRLRGEAHPRVAMRRRRDGPRGRLHARHSEQTLPHAFQVGVVCGADRGQQQMVAREAEVHRVEHR